MQYTPPAGPFGGSVQVAWIPPAAPLLAEAVQAVKDADVAVAFVGLNPSLEGEEMRVSIPGFAGGDRTDLNLPASQEALLEAAAATGKPLVVVLTSGSALAANYAAEHAAAVLELWYGGEEAGTAIAETLAGVNNPAGRLPVTFYRSVDQLPPFDNYSMDGRTYRYFKGDALYGFGFGLSYSKFAYSKLKAKRSGGERPHHRPGEERLSPGGRRSRAALRSRQRRRDPRPSRIPARPPVRRRNPRGRVHDAAPEGQSADQRRRRPARRPGPARRRDVYSVG